MNYTGYKIIQLDEEQLSEFYQNKILDIDLCENEYLAIENENGEIVDRYKFQDGELKKINYTTIGTKDLEIIKPRNAEQYFAFDMLKDTSIPIKLVTGRPGSGKTMSLINAALELVKKGIYTNIVWVRNNIEVKDTTPLGALPGLT